MKKHAVIAGTALYVFAAFTEPAAGPSESNQDFAQNILGANNADNLFDSSLVTASSTGSIIERIQYIQDNIGGWEDGFYGRGWVASTTGDNALVALTQETCEAADDWEWFEDANGNGTTDDPEDGICVQVANLGTNSCWNGDCASSGYENSYIAQYICVGSFPNGEVSTSTGDYLGYAPGTQGATTTYMDGACALCKADCRDGRKDLPDQGSYTTHNNAQDGGVYGPLTPEILKNWKGTRLPTFNDFFGFCGHATGTADDAAGDSYYYSSGASADKTLGYYGHNAGRGASGAPHDKYINLSRTSYEWLSERVIYNYAQLAGYHACSYVNSSSVGSNYRFRAVFRP